MKPLVSVVMPVYNEERFLHESVESILNQSFKNIELIIIDDCSFDSTKDIIEKYIKKDSRVVAFHNERNLKMSKSLNWGIEKAKGIYVARMDGDDISMPTRLELQVEFMEKNPNVGILGGAMEIMNEDGNKIGKRRYKQTDRELRSTIFRYSPFCHPSIMIRKAILDKSGLYDENYNPAEDVELYFRIGLYSKFANLKDILLRYRVRDDSMTTGGLRKMELKSIEARRKFFSKYRVSLFDRIYIFVQLVSLWIMPVKFRIWFFNVLRTYLWR